MWAKLLSFFFRHQKLIFIGVMGYPLCLQILLFYSYHKAELKDFPRMVRDQVTVGVYLREARNLKLSERNITQQDEATKQRQFAILKETVDCIMHQHSFDYKICYGKCNYPDATVIKTDQKTPDNKNFSIVIFNLSEVLLKNMIPEVISFLLYMSVFLLVLAILKRTSQHAQELLLMKRIFTTNMTHELQTPIATLSVSLESLNRYDGRFNTALTKDYLDLMELELGKLSQMVDKILVHTNLENERVHMDFQRLNLARVIQDAVTRLHPRLAQKDAYLTVDIPDQLYILGDEEHLCNAFSNVIDNAIKYSPDKPRVSISVSVLEKFVIIAIEDKGVGIPPKFLRSIFDSYFRIPEKTFDMHSVKGYGLGLSYVKAIVNLHKGHITVASIIDQGSVFYIKLPLHE